MRFHLATPENLRLDHELIWGSVLLATGLLLALLPLESLRLACPFRVLTGWPCLTCGATRGLICLQHLDLAGAFAANPLIAALALFAALYGVYEWMAVLFKTPRLRFSPTRRWEPTAICILAIALLVADWLYLIAAHR